jgi:DNA-binding MarR family transcriptional regulator
MIPLDRQIATLDLILELSVLLNQDATRSLARDGLTTSRAAVLWQLRQRGPVTQRDLADALHVSARTMTGLVDGLVDTGFVTRERHPTDRRAALITFTDRGAGTVAALERSQREFARLLFDDLTGDRFECFSAVLRDIVDRLRAEGLTHEIGADE